MLIPDGLNHFSSEYAATEFVAYSNASQLDLGRRGNLLGAETHKLLLQLGEVGEECRFVLLSQLESLDLALNSLHLCVFLIINFK